VSGWGRLVAEVEYTDRLGVPELLEQALAGWAQLTKSDSGGGYGAGVFSCGAERSAARRFAHVERVRADAVVRGIFGGQTDAFGDDRGALFGRLGAQPG
jgi:hypothetical protein